MQTKTETQKAFDCVEFKRQSQQRLRAEYEERKTEFDSYADFIRAKAHEDEWSRRIWERAQGGSTK